MKSAFYCLFPLVLLSGPAFSTAEKSQIEVSVENLNKSIEENKTVKNFVQSLSDLISNPNDKAFMSSLLELKEAKLPVPTLRFEPGNKVFIGNHKIPLIAKMEKAKTSVSYNGKVYKFSPKKTFEQSVREMIGLGFFKAENSPAKGSKELIFNTIAAAFVSGYVPKAPATLPTKSGNSL